MAARAGRGVRLALRRRTPRTGRHRGSRNPVANGARRAGPIGQAITTTRWPADRPRHARGPIRVLRIGARLCAAVPYPFPRGTG